jgi:glycosyltransferase involved in cell wall biosynthesis
VPVVASDVDGIPEVLMHGNCGYMCSVDDYDSMAKFLIKICKDEKLQKKLGKEGRKKAKQLFGWDKKVDEYVKVYKGLLKNAK